MELDGNGILRRCQDATDHNAHSTCLDLAVLADLDLGLALVVTCEARRSVQIVKSRLVAGILRLITQN